MTMNSWHLFRSAVITACALGIGVAALAYIALFAWHEPSAIGGIFGVACLGLFAGLGHGLIASLGGLLARRASGHDRWTALTSAGAVLVSWVAIVLIVVAGSPSTASVASPLAIVGGAATLLTAGSAHIILRRSNRLHSRQQ